MRSHLPDRLIGLLLGLALLLGAGMSAWAQDVVVRKFEIGPGQNSVGREQAGEGTELDGPQAIYAGRSGEVYVLDQVNSRVVSFGGKDTTGPSRSLALPDGLEPTDLIATENGLVVWDGRPVALDIRDDGLTRSLAVSRDVGAAGDPTVRSMFGQTGTMEAESEDQAKASATRSVTGPAAPLPGGPVRKSVATHGAGPVSALFTPAPGRTAMTVEVTSLSSQARLAQLKVITGDQLGAVELLEVDKLGRLYVLIELVTGRKGPAAKTLIARFAQNSNYEGYYDIPITPEVALARRFVTVSPDGDVYFLRTRKGTVDILGVGFSPVQADKQREVETRLAKEKAKSAKVKPKGKAQPAEPQLAAAGPLSAVLSLPAAVGGKTDENATVVDPSRYAIVATGPLSRRRVIETAFAFEAIRWRITPATYGSDPDWHCSGFDRIRRPGYLRGKIGSEARGVPYCWGCSGSLANFASRITKGALAGNVCTRDDPRRDMAGVDCSSFVSAAWGLSTHFTTAMIPTIAAPIADPWTMRPGDVFNKPNSHVMLFLGYTADRKVQVMEASPGACNGRVCRNVYPMASLLARGYTPRRFRLLETDSTEKIAVAAAAVAASRGARASDIDAAPGHAGGASGRVGGRKAKGKKQSQVSAPPNASTSGSSRVGSAKSKGTASTASTVKAGQTATAPPSAGQLAGRRGRRAPIESAGEE